MTPYAGKGSFKWVAEKTDHVPGMAKGVSRYDKLITKNANRSLKKRVRQQAKKEIQAASCSIIVL